MTYTLRQSKLNLPRREVKKRYSPGVWSKAVDKLTPDNNGREVVSEQPAVFDAIKGLRFVRQIGRGSMGTIYEAEDTQRGVRVAVKVLSPELCGDPDLERRFQREFSVLQALRHPGLVHVLSSGKSGDALYFVMELLQGESLRERVPLSARDLGPIVESLGRTLDAAHEYGVVHGDLKPENIFLSADSAQDAVETKLIDFGLSKVVGLDRLTATGEAVGTPVYMAPEIITGSEVDGRADIYALAVVVYESLSGKTPFEERNPAKLMFEIVSGTRVPLRERMPNVPEDLDAVLARGLSRDPNERQRSAGAFASDLLSALEKHQDALA